MAELNPHNIATFALAILERDPAFRRTRSVMKQIVVCVDTDSVYEVAERAFNYYPDGCWVACHRPERHQFAFFEINQEPLADRLSDTIPPGTTLTVGMMIDAANATLDPRWNMAELETISTLDVENKLSRT